MSHLLSGQFQVAARGGVRGSSFSAASNCARAEARSPDCGRGGCRSYCADRDCRAPARPIRGSIRLPVAGVLPTRPSRQAPAGFEPGAGARQRSSGCAGEQFAEAGGGILEPALRGQSVGQIVPGLASSGRTRRRAGTARWPRRACHPTPARRRKYSARPAAPARRGARRPRWAIADGMSLTAEVERAEIEVRRKIGRIFLQAALHDRLL